MKNAFIALALTLLVPSLSALAATEQLEASPSYSQSQLIFKQETSISGPRFP